jgi:UDP-N-acetylglucosamine 4,6-dehydratase
MSRPTDEEVCKLLDSKVILISGGTGTFGKACIDYIRKIDADCRIRVFSRDEYKQANLRAKYGSDNISYMLGDIRDIERLRLAFAGVDVVFHAAALKHVGLGEYNPREFIETNIIGTENVCRAAIDCGVRQVITLSSDKGVNPINLYGATKMVAEKSTIQHNSYSPGTGSFQGTHFKTVRYGNVAGSRGSAIGLFQRQVERNEKISITDRRMTRFYMLIQEAVDLVMYALLSPIRGGTFIPHLYTFKITDLADAVGGEGYKTETVGMRPGEKLHEMLMTDHERGLALYDGFRPASYENGVYVLPPTVHDWNHSELPKDLSEAVFVREWPYCSDSDNWPWLLNTAALKSSIAYHIGKDAE